MKTCTVTTKWSYNGEYIHTILGDIFDSCGLETSDDASTMTGTYYASKTAIRRELAGLKHHDLISIL